MNRNMFKNKMLRGIFDPKRGKVAADWRKLHNEELHNLKVKVIKSRMIWGTCSTHGRDKKCVHFGWKI
jgi:hypothetical protein